MARPSSSPPQTVTVEGRTLQLTNLDKVLYPATGTTKGEVLHYLAQVAPALLRHAAHRPATRKRWPDGVAGQMFFQKNLDASTPSWVPRRTIRHRSSTNDYVLVDDLATLTWLGQTASLEIHVPQWRFGRTGSPLPPDRLVLDLDPGPGAGLAECAEVARLARAVLQGMDLDPLPVTSGSKGIHLYAPLTGQGEDLTSDAVSAVAKELARHLESEHPDLVVSDMKKSLRAGKVLVDWSQNNGSKTTIAPYSLRGRGAPTVAAPRTWSELEDPQLAQLSYPEVLERLERDGDLLAPLAEGHLSRLEPTPAHLGSFERLETYRAKRDPGRTPEPFGPDSPAGHATMDGAPTFVIQEHHARRLHWDFRLSHDGVLVSWALPKGEPTDPGKNHLAVQTEDHPIEYGSFEGTIPAGEYGGGEVTIWDAGTYEEEKWRDDEVIVTLHSERRGSRRLALIRTGGHGGGHGRTGDDAGSWLIHRTKAQPGQGSPEPEPEPAPPPDPPARPPVRSWKPMLATPGKPGLVAGAGWAYEMKWDGIRALVRVDDTGVTLTSRSGVDLTATYPELGALAGMLTDAAGGAVVLDGEIVALDDKGRPSFRRLQHRMNLVKKGEISAARRRVGVDLMVFDLLEADGRSLARDTYDDRRAALDDALAPEPPVHVPPAFAGDLDGAMDLSRRYRLEGVVAKRRTSTYVAGKRSGSWVKLKHSRAQEAVVVGWRPGHGGRSHLMGSLLLAVPDDEGLRYVGRVGSGFTDRERREIVERLARTERKTSPAHSVPDADASDARWVTAREVVEVLHAGWTDDERPDAPGAGSLRHAVWRGFRPDKAPGEVTVE